MVVKPKAKADPVETVLSLLHPDGEHTVADLQILSGLARAVVAAALRVLLRGGKARRSGAGTRYALAA